LTLDILPKNKKTKKKRRLRGEGAISREAPTPPLRLSFDPHAQSKKKPQTLSTSTNAREREGPAGERLTGDAAPTGKQLACVGSSSKRRDSRRANEINPTTGPATIGGGWAPLRRLDGRRWAQRRPEQEGRSGSSSSPNPKP